MRTIKRTRRKVQEIKSTMSYLLGLAKRQRTCTACAGTIPKDTKHLAYRYKDIWGMKRFNVCFFCTELMMKEIKKSFKKPLKTIRKERKFLDVIETM